MFWLLLTNIQLSSRCQILWLEGQLFAVFYTNLHEFNYTKYIWQITSSRYLIWNKMLNIMQKKKKVGDLGHCRFLCFSKLYSNLKWQIYSISIVSSLIYILLIKVKKKVFTYYTHRSIWTPRRPWRVTMCFTRFILCNFKMLKIKNMQEYFKFYRLTFNHQ